ncbi:hypothetical protein KZZ52_32425 [Dactylosporangium sp. AC04546]|nr:hypothetical protein [Dactylosporangium sp. AC04546]WVK78698.1 hypothetical protein KZZ52_32425 [Dactylosporangium sp. AC04546]
MDAAGVEATLRANYPAPVALTTALPDVTARVVNVASAARPRQWRW